jgi:hypothetical protein
VYFLRAEIPKQIFSQHPPAVVFRTEKGKKPLAQVPYAKQRRQ